jgi:hypothetical protein
MGTRRESLPARHCRKCGERLSMLSARNNVAAPIARALPPRGAFGNGFLLRLYGESLP